MLKILQAINVNLSSLNANLKDKAMEEEGIQMEETRPVNAVDDKMQLEKDNEKEYAEDLMSIKEAVEAIQVLDKNMSKD